MCLHLQGLEGFSTQSSRERGNRVTGRPFAEHGEGRSRNVTCVALLGVMGAGIWRRRLATKS